VEIKHGTAGVPSNLFLETLLRYIICSQTSLKGMQGQVERLNGTVKLATTKGILQALLEGAESESDFMDQVSTQQRWVEIMRRQVEIYNHTPKNLTKVSPMVAHFPEQVGTIN